MNRMPAKVRMAVWCVLIVLFAAEGKALGWHGKAFTIPREAYPIELTQADGTMFSLDRERGNVVLLCFGFTRCPSICPAVLAHLAAVRRSLPEAQRGRVHVVFVSVDPKDDPATLGAYLPMFDESFTGLTGTPNEVATVARAYGAAIKDAPASGPEALIDHSTDTLLIDPSGRVRLRYSMDQLRDHAAVAGDLLRVLGE